LRRLAFATTLVALALAGGARSASAAPTTTTFSGSFTDTQTCPGLVIEASFTGREMVLEDTPTLFKAHVNEVTTLHANGKTLVDNDAFVVETAGGVNRFTGAVFNIQAPGAGPLLMDVGILVFDDNGITFEGGPHPGFVGDFQALCDYLRDP
jgi:hypothetical protein